MQCRYWNNTHISNFIEIRPVGADVFRADGRTDRHDGANSRFSHYCERARKFHKSKVTESVTWNSTIVPRDSPRDGYVLIVYVVTQLPKGTVECRLMTVQCKPDVMGGPYAKLRCSSAGHIHFIRGEIKFGAVRAPIYKWPTSNPDRRWNNLSVSTNDFWG